MTEPSETFRALLRAKMRGTQQEFAARCGVSERGLRKLMDGDVDEPRRTTVMALALAIKVPEKRVRAAIKASRAAAGK